MYCFHAEAKKTTAAAAAAATTTTTTPALTCENCRLTRTYELFPTVEKEIYGDLFRSSLVTNHLDFCRRFLTQVCSYVPGYVPGLPDGIFANPKSPFWHILDGLGMERFGTSYDHLVCLMDI
jgi:hypothetical protein